MSAFLQIWGFPKRGHTQIIDSSTMLVLKSGDPSCWEPPYADLHGIRETAVRTLPPPGHKVGFLEAKRGPSPPKPSSIRAGNRGDGPETHDFQSEKKHKDFLTMDSMVPRVTRALPCFTESMCLLLPQEMLSESNVKLSCIDKAPSLSFSDVSGIIL